MSIFFRVDCSRSLILPDFSGQANVNINHPVGRVGGFPGQLAQVAFFKQALSDEEVSELWRVASQPYSALSAPSVRSIVTIL